MPSTRFEVAGRLQLHRDGYGFLIPDPRIEGSQVDIYLPPSSLGEAMHGDRVAVRIVRVDRTGREEGEVVRILRRAHATLVGEFRVRRKGNVVIPHDQRIGGWVEIPEGEEDLDGLIVEVEILEFPQGRQQAVGRVIEVLGRPGDFGVDVEIVIRKHHLPHHFPPAVLAAAARLSDTIPEGEIARRRDFREFDIVTIDGETARDFDDAVGVDRLPSGNYALQVHIADVSHYVRSGSSIDLEAAMRGTSVYFPDRAVPMLPLELSAGICSLKPGVDRLVLSVLLEIDHHGDVVGQEFTRGIIRSAGRLTYTAVHQALEAGAGGRLELMRDLALILNRKRVKRGSIDFDLPEPLIEFDEWGEMTGITRAPRNIAHRIIEEFMLAANEAVATHLETAGIASLFRIHEPPDAQRVMEFEEIAASFGYSLGVASLAARRFPMVDHRRDGRKVRKDLVRADERVRVSPRNYQALVAKIEGKAEERILSYLMLRSLKQARYSDNNVGHFALATPTYTHFTSPIRRYPDLIVHRILAATMDGEAPPEMELRAIGDDSSFTERRAAEAERELVEWKKAKFMEERVGDEFPALIISSTKFGLFVELTELYVEGLVPADTLRDERAYKIGDTVQVRLDRVDAVERKLQFSIVQPVNPRSKGRPGGSSSGRRRRPSPGRFPGGRGR
jgi:ribonuclease R